MEENKDITMDPEEGEERGQSTQKTMVKQGGGPRLVEEPQKEEEEAEGAWIGIRKRLQKKDREGRERREEDQAKNLSEPVLRT